MVDKPYYDDEFKRWREPGGKFITKEKADRLLGEERRIFTTPVSAKRTPISDAMSRAEGRFRFTAAKYESRKIKTADGSEAAPVPSDIYSAMALSEYYMDTEGDLAQTVIAPMEIAIGRLQVSGKDKKNVQVIKDMIDDLCLEDVAKELYYSMEVYGQAYPLEVWDGEKLESITPANPKGVWTAGQPFTGENTPIEEKFYIYPEFDPNNISPEVALPVPDGNMRAIYAVKAAWQRYAMPPMRRAFRPLGTRQILDEMVRATIEGAKNQLWVFKIGTDKNPADPVYISYLKALLDAGNQDRTGQLVWTHDLVVEQHVPGTIDSLLANEKYAALTDQIMTSRGISLEFVSGTTTTGQASRDTEVNTEVFMGRLKNRRRAIEIWFDYLTSKIANVLGWSEAPTIRFAQIEAADTMAIKNRLKPVYETGVLSARTFLEQAGYDYDSEIAQKKIELPQRDLLTPPLSYVQGVARDTNKAPNKDGGVTVDVNKVEEKLLAKVIAEWREEIPGMWGRLMRGEIGSQDFFNWMQENSDQSLETAYREGYAEGGGQLDVDESYMRRVLDWNIDHLNRFIVQIDQAEDPETLAWRAPLYESHGSRIAFMYGLFQARIEQGAVGWQRVIHPERSQSGSCEFCIEDSKIIHPMTEPFFDHPHGQCEATTTEVRFYRDYAVPLVFPIPKRYGRFDQNSYNKEDVPNQ